MAQYTTIQPAADCGFDHCQMFMGQNYRVNQAITIYQCSVAQVIRFGEQQFFECVAPFVGNPTTYRLQLWKLGIDWCQISDFDLFCMLIPSVPPDVSCILFGKYDFTNLQLMMRKDTEEHVLYDPVNDLIIDNATYIIMREYIRLMMNQYPHRYYMKGRMSRQMAIEEQEIRQRNEEKKKAIGGFHVQSYLFPLITTLLVTPGFKYKRNQLDQINMAQFMITVQRFQIYKATESLMQGMYSGFLDTKGIDKKELNWFRDT